MAGESTGGGDRGGRGPAEGPAGETGDKGDAGGEAIKAAREENEGRRRELRKMEERQKARRHAQHHCNAWAYIATPANSKSHGTAVELTNPEVRKGAESKQTQAGHRLRSDAAGPTMLQLTHPKQIVFSRSPKCTTGKSSPNLYTANFVSHYTCTTYIAVQDNLQKRASP